MNFNFELILFYAIAITGIISLFDILFLAKKRNKDAKLNIVSDYSRSFFPVLVIVFFLRSFLYEPFRIPSESLEPTLLTGDFVLVNKFHYGIRLPVIHKKIINIHTPERGDILVFLWPPNPSVNFIKRVIGLPGDRISYINRELLINGNKISQSLQQDEQIKDRAGVIWQTLKK
jgi:signal peptidase I